MKKFIPLILFVFSLAIRLIGITRVDEAWDEVPVVRYGEQYLNLIKNRDFTRESWKLNKEHPPFSKYFYGATRIISLNVPLFRDNLDQDYPIGRRYTFQRIVSAILGSLTVVLVYLFGKNILDYKKSTLRPERCHPEVACGNRRISLQGDSSSPRDLGGTQNDEEEGRALERSFSLSRVGLFSSLILSLTPYFIAHNRIATQETLVCFLLTLATYLFALGLRCSSDACVASPQGGAACRAATANSKFYIYSGLIMGLAISTKYNSFLFLIFYAAVTLLFFGRDFLKLLRAAFRGLNLKLNSCHSERSEESQGFFGLRPQNDEGRFYAFKYSFLFKNHIVLIPLIAVGVLILIWPWLWGNPVAQFLDSLSRIESSRFQEYFLGTFGEQPPWYYFFVYFVATTPPILLVLLCFFGFSLVLRGHSGPRPQRWGIESLLGMGFYRPSPESSGLGSRMTEKWHWFILLWFLTPFLASFMPLRQDGIRYIFPMYPALALACGLGLDFLTGQFPRVGLLGLSSGGVSELSPGGFRARLFSLAGPLVTCSLLLVTVARFHPYYLDYYNALVGGPKQVYAKRMFDFGYWGEGIRGAIRWVNQNAEPGSMIGINFAPSHIHPTFRPDLEYHAHATDADYIIWNVEAEWRGVRVPDPGSYDIVYTEEVMGVPLVSVSKRVSD